MLLTSLSVVLMASISSVGGDSYLEEYNGYNHWLLFPPPSSSMGVFLALAVPIDELHYDVSLAYNFEANYDLPTNATILHDLEAEYGYRTVKKRTLRDLGRGTVYAFLQSTLSRAGVPGRACLLRAVCEASEQPMFDGLIGNLLSVLLTPSSSEDADVSPKFRAAEKLGKRGADCGAIFNQCPMSLLGLISEKQQLTKQT